MKKITNYKSKALRRFLFAMQNREYVCHLVVKDRMYLVKRENINDTFGKCPSCNGAVIVDQKYCSECGQRLDWRDTREHRYFAIQMKGRNDLGICRKCGEIMHYGDERCPSCNALTGWCWWNVPVNEDVDTLAEQDPPDQIF